jgi:hypothetical protein
MVPLHETIPWRAGKVSEQLALYKNSTGIDRSSSNRTVCIKVPDPLAVSGEGWMDIQVVSKKDEDGYYNGLRRYSIYSKFMVLIIY